MKNTLVSRDHSPLRLVWLGFLVVALGSVACSVDADLIVDSEEAALEQIWDEDEQIWDEGAQLQDEGELMSSSTCDGPPITLSCPTRISMCHSCGTYKAVRNVYWKSCWCENGELQCGDCYWAYDYCGDCL